MRSEVTGQSHMSTLSVLTSFKALLSMPLPLTFTYRQFKCNMAQLHRALHGTLDGQTVMATKGLVVIYRERSATKWENRRSETSCTPIKTG